MKRVIIAVTLLLVICAACSVSIYLQHTVIDEFMAATEEMEWCFKNGNIVGATAVAEAFCKEYQQKTQYFSLLLPHSTLTEVEKSVVSLPSILSYGEPKDFVTEVHRCRLLLQKMHDLEIPTLQNIF